MQGQEQEDAQQQVETAMENTPGEVKQKLFHEATEEASPSSGAIVRAKEDAARQEVETAIENTAGGCVRACMRAGPLSACCVTSFLFPSWFVLLAALFRFSTLTLAFLLFFFICLR